jgi:ATP-dependent RNA helicase DDX46/PRP5
VLQPEEKFWKLMELLGEWFEKGSILIFVDKQIEADELFKELYKVGYKSLVLHGG